MKAFVVTAPFQAEIQDVPNPIAKAGEVVVKISRVGICGTDVEFFNGSMPYLHDGQAKFPIRIGHEFTGTVVRVGEGVDDKWIGKRVVGDVMMGCGKCSRCNDGANTPAKIGMKLELEMALMGRLLKRCRSNQDSY